MAETPPTETDRVAALRHAQDMAAALFAEAERSLVRSGITELQLSNDIHALAAERFGVKAHWHKRIVRAGPNTLRPYREDPPDLMIQPDDILFLDFGPVFEDWEADFGRTYVLGDDPAKHRLVHDLESIFRATKAHFLAHPRITGAELYEDAASRAKQAGWDFGGEIAGHLVGEFPHERIPGHRVWQNIMPGNTVPLEGLDTQGRRRHWILEIHLIDRARDIGGFYEELLTIG